MFLSPKSVLLVCGCWAALARGESDADSDADAQRYVVVSSVNNRRSSSVSIPRYAWPQSAAVSVVSPRYATLASPAPHSYGAAYYPSSSYRGAATRVRPHHQSHGMVASSSSFYPKVRLCIFAVHLYYLRNYFCCCCNLGLFILFFPHWCGGICQIIAAAAVSSVLCGNCGITVIGFCHFLPFSLLLFQSCFNQYHTI